MKLTLIEFEKERVQALLNGHSLESVQDSVRKHIFVEFAGIFSTDRVISLCMETYHSIMLKFENAKKANNETTNP